MSGNFSSDQFEDDKKPVHYRHKLNTINWNQLFITFEMIWTKDTESRLFNVLNKFKQENSCIDEKISQHKWTKKSVRLSEDLI